jgi:uncharacterized protein YecT (DUF1311 family)
MQFITIWTKAAPIAILVTVSLVTFKAHADSVTETAHFTKCMNDVDLGAFKNTQWGACYEAELVRQNKRLELEYKKLQAGYKDVDKKIFNAAKKSWLIHREQWCRYEEAIPMAPTPYVNYRACLVDTTIKQINKIRQLEP